MKRVLAIIGTRPEAIKMAPVLQALARMPDLRTTLVATAQHRDLLDPMLALFGLAADHDLAVMREGQPLAALTARLLEGLDAIIEEARPDIVVAQGDTTSMMVASLVAFYRGIPFAHVEAGLRTGDLGNPFPEELNRLIAGRIAALHFSPTGRARAALLREGVPPETIHVTGNTGIDALLQIAKREPPCPVSLEPGRKLILVTAHRRESHGEPLRAIFGALRELLEERGDIDLLVPLHPAPAVQDAARVLGTHPRLHLRAPLSYPDLVGALRAASLVLTDSGGLQEEAPALGKPVLVLREATERPEAIEAGVAMLVGRDPARIRGATLALLDDQAAYGRMARTVSPYGDGAAAPRIAAAIARFLSKDGA